MFDWRTIAVVGVGAAIGGVLRLLVTQLVVARAGAPYVAYATLFINVSGSFLIGLVLGVAQARTDLSPLWRFFLATGILGGYTTFSTFSYEALTLGTTGSGLAAAAYVIGSITLGIAGAYAGLATARAFS